ncbi:hypothetical protein JCM3775_007416 [Rhodotorula graminis]
MSSQPEPEPSDELFRQLKELYSFFKVPSDKRSRDQCTPDEYERKKAAHTQNTAIARAPASFARCCGILSPEKRQRALELLLGHYCDTRAAAQRNFKSLTSLKIDPVRRFNTLLHHLVVLYDAPIDEREFEAFRDLRHKLGPERRVLYDLRAHPRDLSASFDAAEAVINRLIAEGQERVEQANAARVRHLVPVKAAWALLHEPASLVFGPASVAQAAIEVYMSRLGPGQQAAAVARLRDLLFEACEDRALHGEALDAADQLDEVLGTLRAGDIGHAICVACLTWLLRFYESRDASEAVVELKGVLDRFCGAEWTLEFPKLALTQQWYAAATVKALLRHVHERTDRQILAQVARIFPLDSPGTDSWAHACPAQPAEHPPVLSLGHRPWTHGDLGELDSTTSVPVSRYFPQSRRVGW